MSRKHRQTGGRFPARNPFQVLGVNPYASDLEIKQAFRRLAKKYHPDQNGDNPVSEERFKELNNAYDTIVSLQRKGARLPRESETGRAAGFLRSRSQSRFGSRIAGFFRSDSRDHDMGGARGEDIERTVRISFTDAVKGTTLDLHTDAYTPCVHCDGTAAEGGSAFSTCPKCRGVGHVLEGSGGYLIREFCPRCLGGGSVIKTRCRRCRGDGRIKGINSVKVKIPPNVENNARFVVRGKGNAGKLNGPAGDMIITVSVAEHPYFSRKGDDIYYNAAVPFTTAVLGGATIVQTIDGPVKMTVPPNTNGHTILRLKGRGVNGVGDQYNKIIIDVPSRLTEKERRLLRSFAHLHGDPVIDGKKQGMFRRFLSILGFS